MTSGCDEANSREERLRKLLEEYLAKRLGDKVQKLDDNDEKVADLQARFSLHAWLEDAANRVSQIKLVTHIVKTMHPDAKGSQLYCIPRDLPVTNHISSRCLSEEYDCDVVGNAAALDVFGFLSQQFEGKSILQLIEENDRDLISVLSANSAKVQKYVSAFLDLKVNKASPSSHTLAKQVYWLVGQDPTQDSDFHLLAPLYSSALAHYVYGVISEHRFGEESKAAREIRRKSDPKDRFADTVLYDYVDLAVQKFGGSKPQNISYLNSKRKGQNYLLRSIPPQWQFSQVRPIFGKSSVFDSLIYRKEIRFLVSELKRFLEGDPPRKEETRIKRNLFIKKLIEELELASAELLTLEPGWTADSRCNLPDAEKLWLDPRRGEFDSAFSLALSSNLWQEEIGSSFAKWLNAQLNERLPMGDIEYLFLKDFFGIEMRTALSTKV